MGGVFKGEYIWWNIQANPRMWGGWSEVQTQGTLSTENGYNDQNNGYEFRANNQGFYINDKVMQAFRPFSGFLKAPRLTA